MSRKVVVLGGAGAMGQVIVRDLCQAKGVDEVVIADFNTDKANELKATIKSNKLSVAFADIKDKSKMAEAFSGAQCVINSTPYQFNVNVMEAALASGLHYIDLGGLFHTTRKQLELDSKFKDKKLTAVLGMGAAPGMTNVMAAKGAEELDTVESIDIVIGCVDFVAVEQPFCPPYALDTILDEYTLEPMVYENGKFKAVPPVSGEISVDFAEPVGKSDAILTLHSEVATLPLTYEKRGIKSCTFRLGLPRSFHHNLKFLVDLGLGSSDDLKVDGVAVKPRKFLAALLQRLPQPSADPDDCEIVRVDVRGKKNGRQTLVRLETTVVSDDKWKVSSGALDTGVPPSIVAQMILDGQISNHGVLAPEACVPTQPFFDELAKRNMLMRQIKEESLVESKEPAKIL